MDTDYIGLLGWTLNGPVVGGLPALDRSWVQTHESSCCFGMALLATIVWGKILVAQQWLSSAARE